MSVSVMVAAELEEVGEVAIVIVDEVEVEDKIESEGVEGEEEVAQRRSGAETMDMEPEVERLQVWRPSQKQQ
jgi:hypothetical protein